MSENRRVINIMETKLVKFKQPSSDNDQILETKEDNYDNRLFSTVNIDIEAIDYMTNKPNEQAVMIDKASVYFHCIHCGLVVATESNYLYK
jgi:hypothetical protein